MIGLISGVLSIAGMILGNALLSKWLGALRMYFDSIKDPVLKKMVFDEYQRQSKEAGDILNQKPPI